MVTSNFGRTVENDDRIFYNYSRLSQYAKLLSVSYSVVCCNLRHCVMTKTISVALLLYPVLGLALLEYKQRRSCLFVFLT